MSRLKELDIVETLEALQGRSFDAGPDRDVEIPIGAQVVILSVFDDGKYFDVEMVHEDGSGTLAYSVPAEKLGINNLRAA